MIEPEQVKKLYKEQKLFKKECKGLVKKWEFFRIIDYDLTARTINGVGWILIESPFIKDDKPCRVSLNQVSLYEHKIKRRKEAKNTKLKRRSK